MKTCIIIPMFNEERMAEKCLQSVLPYVHKLPDTRVVVVDDGSSDKTASLVEPYSMTKDSLLDFVRHPENLGYGAALQTGVRHAQSHRFDYVLFMDSDLTNHPKYLVDFINKIEEGHEYIKATRYSLGGGVDGVPRSSWLFSRVGNIVARILFGIPLSDSTNGFRAVRTSLFDGLDLQENGFAIIMEELYHIAAKRPRFAEIPYILTSRGAEEGTSSFAYTPLTIKTYLSYALKRARDRAFGRSKVVECSSSDNVPML
jgi:dolichol-phosphate mannosyltransferase